MIDTAALSHHLNLCAELDSVADWFEATGAPMNAKLMRWAAETLRRNTAAPKLAAALRKLRGSLNNVEVLGEWSAFDINQNAQRTTRAKVNEVLAEVDAALAEWESQS